MLAEKTNMKNLVQNTRYSLKIPNGCRNPTQPEQIAGAPAPGPEMAPTPLSCSSARPPQAATLVVTVFCVVQGKTQLFPEEERMLKDIINTLYKV